MKTGNLRKNEKQNFVNSVLKTIYTPCDTLKFTFCKNRKSKKNEKQNFVNSVLKTIYIGDRKIPYIQKKTKMRERRSRKPYLLYHAQQKDLLFRNGGN